jgi:hypothetical protein
MSGYIRTTVSLSPDTAEVLSELQRMTGYTVSMMLDAFARQGADDLFHYVLEHHQEAKADKAERAIERGVQPQKRNRGKNRKAFAELMACQRRYAAAVGAYESSETKADNYDRGNYA